MNERIQQVLDGDLPTEQLTPEEVAELGAYLEAVQGVMDGLPQDAPPDLAPAVMQQIGAAVPQAGVLVRAGRTARRTLDWIWTPRPLALRPAYAMVAAIAGFGLVLLFGRTPMPEPATAEAGSPKVFVQFRVDAPGAAEVRLAGDFSGWQPAYELHESAPGVWSVIVPVEPGVHHYAFIVDGDRWMADPHAPQVEDGFGGANSRLAVLLPEMREAS